MALTTIYFMVFLCLVTQWKGMVIRMDTFWQLVKAFLLGGFLCAIGQILIDKTKLTPARILTGYVVAGVILGAVGIYEPIAKWGGAGATVPLTGFGSSLAKGVRNAPRDSFLSIFSGGLTATAAGIAAAIFFSFLFALLFKPKEK